MPTTLYHRDDTHTINNQTLRKLMEELANTDGDSGYLYVEDDLDLTADVYIRHADGSRTTVQLNAVDRWIVYGQDGTTLFEDTWDCPETDLETTDALEITVVLTPLGYIPEVTTFISQRLGVTKLKAATWTFYHEVYYEAYTDVRVLWDRHATEAHNTRIEGIETEAEVLLTPILSTQQQNGDVKLTWVYE